MPSCKIVAFGDASFANLHDKGSQGAYIILLADKNGKYCPLSWQSKRLQRVVRSTLAAECLAIGQTIDAAIHLQTTIHEMIPTIKPPIHIFSDSDSLVKSSQTSTPVTDRGLQVEIALIRDRIIQKSIDELRWIPTKYNLADSLTKVGANSSYLLAVLEGSMCFDLESGIF